MENLPLPKTISYKEIKKNKTQLIIEPLFTGYGITIANSLRRVLLSSLTGASVTKVKIKGVSHEFSTLPNIKEDMVELISNIKKIRLILISDEPVKLKLKIKGEKVVRAKEIDKNAQAEITNPDLIIAHLTDKKAELEIEMTAKKGQGYETVESRTDESLAANEISIDSVYSPIINVSFNIESVRVGKRTDYEKLKMKIQTDGTISPEEAIDKTIKVLINHLELIPQKKILAKKTKKVSKKTTKKTAPKKVKKTVKKATPKKIKKNKKTKKAK